MSLGEVARQMRAQKNSGTAGQSATGQSVGAAGASNATGTSALRPVTRSAEAAEFYDATRLALLSEDFAKLDKMADEARSSKAVFPAGERKLFIFYQTLETVDRGASEAEWQQHLQTLQHWMTARPRSITARVALADAYLQYAWAGRGGAYANQVTEAEWQLFGERTHKAAEILMEAAKQPAKCPQWYLMMERVGRAQGLSKEQLTAVFEKAIAFDPDYFFYYQEHAVSLLPKWMGEPGDVAAFAAESDRRVGGKKGAAIYYLIAASLCNRCGDFDAADFSWPRLQEGFAGLEELYGMNLLKLNQYARMAVTYGDKAGAAEAFTRLGEQWDPRVWGERARFEMQRRWAGLAASPQPAAAAPSPDPGRRMAEMLVIAQQAGNQGRWSDAAQATRQAIDYGRPLPGTEAQLAQAYLLLAADEQRQGHVQQAEAALSEGVQTLEQKSGGNSEAAAQMLNQSSAMEERMGDDRQAEADLRRAIHIREKLSGLAAKQVTDDQTHLAWIWQRQGRNKEAIELLQQVIKRIQPLRPKDPGIAQALAALAMTYQQMGSYQEAEGAYLEWIHLLESIVPADSPELSIPYLRMASLYQAWGRQADAQRVEQKGKALESGQR